MTEPNTGIQTLNSQMVGARLRVYDNALVVTVSAPKVAMTADDALRHAAWLVATAEPYATHPFTDVLEAVQRV